MLKRTEKIKPTHHGKLFESEKETFDELLERLGVIKVKSYPCTPEHKPQQADSKPTAIRLG